MGSLGDRKLWFGTTNTGRITLNMLFKSLLTPVRDAVEFRGGFTAKGLTPGNQLRQWHGTNRGCRIGDRGQTAFCSSSHCSLCCIIKTSFDIEHSGKKTGLGRFGNGIYTSSTSSKSDIYPLVVTVLVLILDASRSNDYSDNLVSSPWKAILLTYVVAGKAKKFTTNQPRLTQAPVGFDSV